MPSSFKKGIGIKCTGAEINTGTDDAKFVTPKAIADSFIPYCNSADILIQTGWGFVTGTNPWTQKSVACTLATTFDSTDYFVMITLNGYKTTDPSSQVDVAGAAGACWGTQVVINSASQFTAYITASSSEANTNRAVFSYIAIGTKAK